MKIRECDYHFSSLLLVGTTILATLMTAVPAWANTTPVASFVPVPYTNTSAPFNTRLEELTTKHTDYTEM
jgi:hypothetical protein